MNFSFKSILLFLGFLLIQAQNSNSENASFKEIHNFYSTLNDKKGSGDALDMLKNNSDLASLKLTSQEPPLEIALRKFNKTSENSLNDDKTEIELLKFLLHENLRLNMLNPLKGFTHQEIKNSIQKIVSHKKQQKVALFLLDTAMEQLKQKQISQEKITDEFFFERIADSDPKLIAFLQKNPQWLKHINPSNGDTPLHTILKNYSNTPNENQLIKIIIDIEPSLLLMHNKNYTGVMEIVSGHHNLYKELHKLLYTSIKKSKKLSSDEKSNYIKKLQLMPAKKKLNGKTYKIVSKI